MPVPHISQNGSVYSAPVELLGGMPLARLMFTVLFDGISIRHISYIAYIPESSNPHMMRGIHLPRMLTTESS